MDMFSLLGASEELEEPEKLVELSPDDIFSNGNGASDDFSDDSFDADADVEAEDLEEESQEAPGVAVPAAMASEPVQAPAVAPLAVIAPIEKKIISAKEPVTMSELASELLNLSDADFAALVKAREEKKKEGLKAEKLVAVQKSLESVSYDELLKVEEFVRSGCKSVSTLEPKVLAKDSLSTQSRIRFELKAVHTVENLLASLAKGNDYKVNEILQAVGVVKGMDLNGAASLDSYIIKYKANVLKKAIEAKQIATSGERTQMMYFLV